MTLLNQTSFVWHSTVTWLARLTRIAPKADTPKRSNGTVLVRCFAGFVFLASVSFGVEPRAEAPVHWALRPIQKVEPPILNDPWIANPIDAFILARLRQQGLSPSRAAEAQTLVRRMFLVMHGLPPTLPEMQRWGIREPGPEFIDYLLASPRYGERWAQHWLDVIRWAETVGFETNSPRPNAWPYRDWLIASLNADKPYDRFLFEQIAGDTEGEDAALGFLVSGPANLPGQIGRDEESMRQARQDELDEVIRTVSQAVLGLTIGCARCHDHKFDPITLKDYYAMQAIFAGLRYGDRRWRGEENDRWSAEAPRAAERVAAFEEQLESLRIAFKLRPPLREIEEEVFPAVTARSVRMTLHSTGSGGPASLYELEIWSARAPKTAPANLALRERGARASASSFALENQTRHPDNLNDGSVDARQAYPWKAEKSGPAWVQIDLAAPALIDRVVWHRGESIPADYEIAVETEAGKWTRVAHARNRLPRADDRRKAADVPLDGLTPEQTDELIGLISKLRAAREELARLSAGPQVYGAVFEKPDTTWLLKRGDPMQRAERVDPAVPAALGRVELQNKADEAEVRRALARHLIQHPLTARVIVNRIWQQHFGEGLVETPSDFGKMGSAPTHPELLEWLAAEFIREGRSLKKLHRLILTSSTFRQSSAPREKHQAVDAGSRLLWRFPPRRLEAEAIRDSVLAVSGKLNLKMGGPGFDFFNQKGGLTDYKPVQEFREEGWRRMIYATKIRMQTVDIFGAFDCPDAGQMAPKRPRSVTPIQALSLLNSPFMQHQAGFLAARVKREEPRGTAAQVARAIKLAFNRDATAEEVTNLASLAQTHGLETVCRALLNANEFVFIP